MFMKEEKHVGLWILFEIHPNKHFSPAQMQQTVGLYLQMIKGIVACISHSAMDGKYILSPNQQHPPNSRPSSSPFSYQSGDLTPRHQHAPDSLPSSSPLASPWELEATNQFYLVGHHPKFPNHGLISSHMYYSFQYLNIQLFS